MAKTLLAILLGVLIGAGCRWFDVPVPSPPRLLGALLVVAMTLGYMATDKMMPAPPGSGSPRMDRTQSTNGPGTRADSVSAR
jgi:XapX domain-containing protein